MKPASANRGTHTGYREPGPFQRALGGLTAGLFLWAQIHPAFMGVAQAQSLAEAPGLVRSVHQVVADALAETGQTLERLEQKMEQQRSPAAEKQELKQLRQWLTELEQEALDDFESTEAHLRAHGLPSAILERHEDAVAAYRSELEATLADLGDIEAAGSESQLQARVREAKAALAARHQPLAHRPFDAQRTPFRVPSSEPRAPRKSPQQYSALQRQQRTLVASSGSMAGVLAASALTPPGPEHLAPTEDAQLTPAIRDLAAQLGHNPVTIYNWVRNNVAFVPSYGSIQGSHLTMQNRRGNAFDTSSLLVALLRASDIPARYVLGTVEIPMAKAANWLGGVALPEAAVQLLAQGGVPVETVREAGQVTALLIEHVWVEALVDFGPGRGARHRVGDAWVPLDASFKQFGDSAGMPILRDVPSDAQFLVSQLRNSAQIDENEGRITGFDVGALQAGLAEFGQQVDSYIAGRVLNATVADVVGLRGITALVAPVLAAGLPYKPLVEGARLAALPDSVRHRLRFSLYASDTDRANGIAVLSFEKSLPALSGSRLTLAFTPSTADDQATLDSYFPKRHADGSPVQPEEFPQEVPGYLIKVTPQVLQAGVPAVAGGQFVLGSTLVMTSGLYDPAQALWNDADDVLYAGEYQAFVVDGQGVAAGQVADLGARVAGTAFKLGNGQADSVTRDDVTGDLLHQAGLSYFATNDVYAALFQRLSGVAAFRLPSHARAVAELLPTYNFGVPVRVAFPGVALRLDRLTGSAVSRGSDISTLPAAAARFQRQGLERGSSYAHLVLENLFLLAQGSSVGASAIRALAASLSLSQPVYSIGPSNADQVVPTLQMPERDKADLRNGVYAGMRGVASQYPVTLGAFSGSGYLLTDDATGAGDYRLTGGATGLLHTGRGMPWLALAQPFQAAVAVGPAFSAAQALDTAQEVLLGNAGILRWSDFSARNELLAGLLAGELSGIQAPDVLFRATTVQTTHLGTSAADALKFVNRPPVIFSSPVTSGQGGTPYRYQVSAADPEGDPLGFSIVRAPSGVSVNATGLVSWDDPVAGTWTLTVRVSDGKLHADQTYSLRVANEPQPLEINVSVHPPVVDPGATVTVTVTATGGTGNVSRSVVFNNQTLPVPPSGQVQLTAPAAPGVYRVTGSATDDNITVSKESQFGVRNPNDSTPPVATITTPAADAGISSEVDVIGTASDNTALAYYTLRVRAVGSGEAGWKELKRGTAPVTNGVLGVLNPSTLANGLFELSLVAVDVNGASAGVLIPVEILGDLKIGQFSISFEDLNIEAGGIPVRVTRTYDTRRKDEKLAFGYGWSVDFQDLRVRKNMTLGLAWNIVQRQFQLCVIPAGKRKVTIALPDGSLHRFEAYLEQECAVGTVPPVNVLFRAVGSTSSRLEIVNHPFVEARGGQLFDWDALDTFNPTEFKLTTEDNYSFFLAEGVGIDRIVDPFNNTLTYTSNGLIHSNGRSIAFTRDAQNRITAVTDPAGKKILYAYDTNGDLVSVTDREGRVSRLTYNRSHGLVDYTDPRGVSVAKYIYDDQGRLIATVDGEGKRIDVVHETDANREVVKNRRGFTTTYIYDASGNVTEQIDALGNRTTFSYDANGNETSVTDPLGNTTTRTFDGTGKVLTETDPLGNKTTNAYLASPSPDAGKIASVRDARGSLTTFEYPFKFLQTISEPLGRSTSIRFDASSGNLTSLDVAGLKGGFAYDAKGNRTSATDGAGAVTTFVFDGNGRQVGSSRKRTNDQGVLVTVNTARTVDANGRTTADTDGVGATRHFTYDAAGNLTSETDPRGKVTQFEYDSSARLVRTTYPDGTAESTEYDGEGNETSQTDRGGRITRFEYDALNRLTLTIHPDGTVTENRYDAAGRLSQVVDARGKVTTNEYDKAGRLIKITDPLGNSTSFGYDPNGNRTSITDAKAQTIGFEYDALNHLVKATQPDGTFSTISWLPSGLKASETDRSGRVTRYTYDGNGRLTQVLQTNAGADRTTTYAYDELGNKVSQTDARGKVTKFAYDNGSRLTRRTLPGGQSESFGYDPNGNQTSRTDHTNRATTFKYDDVNREIERTLPDGSRVTTSFTQSGQVETVTDSRGATRFTYDALDRLTRKSGPEGEIRYAYDANGNKLSEMVVSGTTTRTVTYGYDDANRLISVTSDGRQTTYSYDANGNRERISYPNNTTTTYAYDALNRLARLTHGRTSDGAILADYRYTLAANGQRTAVEESDGQGVVRTVAYNYDDLSRLTREQVTHREASKNRTTTYTYDAVGNRLTRSENGVTTNYTYDDNDRLLTENTGSTAITYAYDANGNTTRKESRTGGLLTSVTTYAYDPESRLTEVKQGASDATLMQVVRHAYDAEGNRIRTTQPDGTQITYLVDTNRQFAEVLEEVHTSMLGTTRVSYVHGDDLLSQTRGGQRTYYHQDGLGSTRLLTSDAGAVADTYTYEAFGELEEQTGSTSNTYLFTGEPRDPATGFYYLRSRWTDPSIGRFITQDAFQGIESDPPSLHKYLYVNADPVNNIDPSGELGLVSLSPSVIINVAVRPIFTRAGATAISKFVLELAFEYITGIPVITSPRNLVSAVKSFKSIMGNLAHGGINKLRAGNNFEATVKQLFNLDKNKICYKNGVPSTPPGCFIPDFLVGKGARLLEVKTSAGAVHKGQFQEFIRIALRGGQPMSMIFLQKPSPADLQRLQRWAAEISGDSDEILLKIVHILD